MDRIKNRLINFLVSGAIMFLGAYFIMVIQEHYVLPRAKKCHEKAWNSAPIIVKPKQEFNEEGVIIREPKSIGNGLYAIIVRISKPNYRDYQNEYGAIISSIFIPKKGMA